MSAYVLTFLGGVVAGSIMHINKLFSPIPEPDTICDICGRDWTQAYHSGFNYMYQPELDCPGPTKEHYESIRVDRLVNLTPPPSTSIFFH